MNFSIENSDSHISHRWDFFSRALEYYMRMFDKIMPNILEGLHLEILAF